MVLVSHVAKGLARPKRICDGKREFARAKSLTGLALVSFPTHSFIMTLVTNPKSVFKFDLGMNVKSGRYRHDESYF